jgi:hypothetical protein
MEIMVSASRRYRGPGGEAPAREAWRGTPAADR